METIVSVPQGKHIKNTPRSYYWFDGEGILYVVSKKGAPPGNIEEMKQLLEDFTKETGGKKFCILTDITHAQPNDKPTREFIAVEFPKIVKAMAMVSASPVGRVVGSLFLALKPGPYPAKIFNNEQHAKEWLKQYL